MSSSTDLRATTPGNSAAFQATTPEKAQREDFTWTLNSVQFLKKDRI